MSEDAQMSRRSAGCLGKQHPGVVEPALTMPDIHWGYGFPIGGVAAFDSSDGGEVSHGGVGFDINCGVRLIRAANRATVDEEMSEAYKDATEVLNTTDGASIGKKVARLRPLIVVKG